MFNSKVENEDKWITIKPNGEENKGRHLLLKDGETVEDAMHRNGWYSKRQAKKEKNKKTVEEIKQDYINGKISAKEAEKLLPKDTDTTSLAIAKYNKEHGIKDFDFDDNKQSDTKDDGEEKNTITEKKITSILKPFTNNDKKIVAHWGKETEDFDEYLIQYDKKSKKIKITRQPKDTMNNYRKYGVKTESGYARLEPQLVLETNNYNELLKFLKKDDKAQNSLTDTILNAISEVVSDCIKVNNGFITTDQLDENGERKVIWIPENVHYVKPSEKARVLEICDNYKQGDETIYNFEHTRIKPTEEQNTI